MKHFFAVSLLFLTLSVGPSCQHSHPPLKTVPEVTVKRYMGHWHEIFRLPNSFQRDDSKATADYSLQPDGTVRVVNTEIRPDGTHKTATGTAKAVPGSDSSRLKVSFTGLAALAPVPEEGNYWILKLAPDYSTALVGTPDRKYLWLLSRTPNLTRNEQDTYLETARQAGFPTEKLLYTQ